MSDITKKINGLNKEELVIFKKELEKKGLRLTEKNQILKRKDCNNKSQKINQIDEEESYKLSHAQSRLWVLDQYEEDCIAYNMPASYIMEGELNIDHFKQAFSYMVDRHESLRTVFVTENGEPRQKILNNPDSGFELIDVRSCIDPQNEARILAEKDLLTSFNLETGSLVRF
ncbi:MAG: hypothetical protein GY760_11065, partial [Deltaproteobacteria bacterium]|nr:hypothetical protein [Deltaproteobacteria bacterium]